MVEERNERKADENKTKKESESLLLSCIIPVFWFCQRRCAQRCLRSISIGLFCAFGFILVHDNSCGWICCTHESGRSGMAEGIFVAVAGGCLSPLVLLLCSAAQYLVCLMASWVLPFPSFFPSPCVFCIFSWPLFVLSSSDVCFFLSPSLLHCGCLFIFLLSFISCFSAFFHFLFLIFSPFSSSSSFSFCSVLLLSAGIMRATILHRSFFRDLIVYMLCTGSILAATVDGKVRFHLTLLCCKSGTSPEEERSLLGPKCLSWSEFQLFVCFLSFV